MTNTREWLASRERDVPGPLVEHVRAAVESAEAEPADALAAAAVSMLARALATEPMTRAQALDVLGADALITYALEAAAEAPGTLTAHADAAMRQIAALAPALAPERA